MLGLGPNRCCLCFSKILTSYFIHCDMVCEAVCMSGQPGERLVKGLAARGATYKQAQGLK